MAQQPELTPIESTALSGYHYDADSRRFTVQFTGTGRRYVYDDVPAEKVEAFRENKSPGAYFASKIKPQHKATKL